MKSKKKQIAAWLSSAAALLTAVAGILLGGDLLPLGDEPVPQAKEDNLAVHYIDVGQADCILLSCGGEFMLIDGGNMDDGRLVVSYLEQQGVQELKAVICTHAHEDHVGGLPAVLAVYPTRAVYSPTTTYASKYFDDFMRYVDQQRLTVTLPVPGDGFDLGGARVTILGPVKDYPDTNNTSIVTRVDYGETSFLFTGDMEQEAENDLIEAGANLRCDVLKVGHHGSNTSSGYRFLYEAEPEYGVISVGTGNTYGHPHEEPMSRLFHAGVTVFRTDYLGTVVARSDGAEITFTWDNQNAAPENAEYAGTFIGNRNSLVFHAGDCSGLPSERNRVLFESYREAIEAGYTPCRSCLGG